MPTSCLKLHGEKIVMQQNSVYFFSLFRNSFLPKQRHMIYVINLIFHGDFDAIVFISIWLHQDGLERREGHPGGVQQEKLMFPLSTCDTCYTPIFYGKYDGNISILI